MEPVSVNRRDEQASYRQRSEPSTYRGCPSACFSCPARRIRGALAWSRGALAPKRVPQLSEHRTPAAGAYLMSGLANNDGSGAVIAVEHFLVRVVALRAGTAPGVSSEEGVLAVRLL